MASPLYTLTSFRRSNHQLLTSPRQSERMQVVVVPTSPAHDLLSGGTLHANPSGDPSDYFYHHSSAPTSPTRASANYPNFTTTSAAASLDCDGELRDHPDEFDFVFDFSAQFEKGAIPTDLAVADDLFEAGKIRALKPPPPFHHHSDSDRSRVGGGSPLLVTKDRGRVMALRSPFLSSSRSRRESRSLSPSRDGGKTPSSSPSPSPSPSTTTSYSKGGGGKRWRILRDLLLFRSASEGRATGRGSKDPLRKYTALSSLSEEEDPKKTSFRRENKGGAMVSANDAHYTANRVASEELKKKKLLLRHGLFGYLRFNPVVHRGFNGSSFAHGGDRNRSP